MMEIFAQLGENRRLVSIGRDGPRPAMPRNHIWQRPIIRLASAPTIGGQFASRFVWENAQIIPDNREAPTTKTTIDSAPGAVSSRRCNRNSRFHVVAAFAATSAADTTVPRSKRIDVLMALIRDCRLSRNLGRRSVSP